MTVRQRVVGSGVGLLAGAFFIILAILVARQVGVIQRFDLAVHASLRQYGLAHPPWLAAMRGITHLGDTLPIVALDVTVVALCLWHSRPRTAVFVTVVALSVWAVRLAARDLVGRTRPTDALWPAQGMSFPSGHATNSAATAALVVIACWPLIRRAGRIGLVLAATIYALSVGLSRVVGGVHWPSDVAAGLLLATAMVCIAAAMFPPNRPPADRVFLSCSSILLRSASARAAILDRTPRARDR